MFMLLSGPRFFIRASVTRSVVAAQVSITLSYLSSSDIRPRLKFFSYFATFSSACLTRSCFSSGIIISATDTVIAPFVEYLNPRSFILSSISAVAVFPCFLKHLSITFPIWFFASMKSTSREYLSTLLSTYPRFCGMLLLNMNLPTVDSTSCPLSFSSSFILTLTLA